MCSAGVPSRSPLLPPSFSPPTLVSLSPQRVRLRRELSIMALARSQEPPPQLHPHTTRISQWETRQRHNYPLQSIPNTHIYIKTYTTTTTSYSPQFFSTYLKSTSPSFPLNVNSITYCIFCLPHCITLLCNNVNLCEQSVCYVQSAPQKETKQMPLHPHTAFLFFEDFPNQPVLKLSCWLPDFSDLLNNSTNLWSALCMHEMCPFLFTQITKYCLIYSFPLDNIDSTYHQSPASIQKHRLFMRFYSKILNNLKIQLCASQHQRHTGEFTMQSEEAVNWLSEVIFHL